MCGISGVILRSQPEAPAALIRAMNTAIAHRGPDGEGYLELTTRDNRYAVALGHRRLAIIDLETGDQPIGSEDGSIQIIFNGEIYNFPELRAELGARGHTFATNSDTEAIVHAYEEYGVDCVNRLRGMFAFAIWDNNQQRLFVARDRFGQKPVFLHQRDDELYFASEIKSLLQVPGLGRRVNQQVLADYLTYRYVPGPATLFDGIVKLPPGHTLVWQAGKVDIRRYYTPPDGQPGPQTDASESQLVERFMQELDEAVHVRMVSDVPFGAFLSGGIDSSAIVALMSRHLDQPVKTFSVGFEESAYSELKYAKTIADRYHTDHHELAVSQNHLMDELPKLIRYRDAPVAEASDIPIYLLSVEARKSVKMVLTGEGSDEFLGGYPKHLFERFVGGYQIVPGPVRRSLIEPLVHLLPYRFRRAKIAIDNLGVADWENRMAGWFGAIPADDVPRWLHGAYGRQAAAISAPSQGLSALRKILYFDQSSWLPDNLLERGDRMTMAASLEARMPFMDHKLAAFITTLPDRYRIRGKTSKWILRQAIRQLLPDEIINRPKVGFRVPVNEWFRGPMRGYLEDHLRGPDSLTRGYYDHEILDRTINEHVTGRHNHEKTLWCLLNLEIWQREFQMTL